MVAWLFLATILVILMTSVQTGHSPPEPGTFLLVLPVPGRPISFEQVEERSHRPKDGASSVETIVRSVYRDSFGRLRIERAGSERSSAASGGVIQIIDPVASIMMISTESEKVGYCLPLPKSSAIAFVNGSLADVGASSRKWISRTEHLGTQKIEGLEFEGTRIVQTSEDEAHVVKSLEQWHSGDLNLIGLVVVSVPDGSYMARIQNVHRVEPDAALFEIPPGCISLNLPLGDKP